jgi:hypothetical protein
MALMPIVKVVDLYVEFFLFFFFNFIYIDIVMSYLIMVLVLNGRMKMMMNQEKQLPKNVLMNKIQ